MATYTYTRTITDEELVDLMETALQGVSYWAGEARTIKSGKPATAEEFDGWTSEALPRGFDVEIYDAEEEKWHTLTLEKLLKGLSKRTSFDPENYDTVDGDAIIQYALFDEIVYG